MDRSLGAKGVPKALRELGLDLTIHTLRTVYGEHNAQRVKDVTWIGKAGREDWVILTKDERVRKDAAERRAIQRAKLRVFCLFSQVLPGERQEQIFSHNIHRIIQRSRKRGPFVDVVYGDEVRRAWPL